MPNATYNSKSPLFFLLAWTALNLVQAGFTGLFHDEALYWMCSQRLDWGFWDHPPAAALMIRAGYALSPGDWGVRLFTVLASTLTLYGVWRLVRPASNLLFFTLVFSILLVHIGGIMSAPDIPLLLTATWFLVLFREYQQNDKWKLAAGLALLAAAMAYSKYHGAIFLFFLFLSQPSLLSRRSFWLIPPVALLLFAPHLYWQWEQDFPSFRYHLAGRAGEAYEWRFVGDYIGGQLLVMGLLVSLPLLAAAFRSPSSSPFDRSMKWVLWGVLGFFLLQSFRQRTEANWTATAVIPLIYLSCRYIEHRPQWKRWLYMLAIPSILAIILLRMEFASGFLPDKIFPRKETIGWESWAKEVSELAGERPVVFINTYRLPSYYRYFTRKPAHSFNVAGHAGNQFELWVEKEAALQGKEVMLVSGQLERGIPFFPGEKMKTNYRFEPNFRSFNRVQVRPAGIPSKLRRGEIVEADIIVKNRSVQPVSFEEGGRAVQLCYSIFRGDELVAQETALAELPAAGLAGKEEQRWSVKLKAPDTPGAYRYHFSFQAEGLPPGRNDHLRDLEVE